MERLCDNLLVRALLACVRGALALSGSLILIDLDAVGKQTALVLGAELTKEGEGVLSGVAADELRTASSASSSSVSRITT